MSKENGVSRGDFIKIGGGVAGFFFLKGILGFEAKPPVSAHEPETPLPEPSPVAPAPTVEKPPEPVAKPSVEAASRPETGVALLKEMGLQGKVTYIVYGRPQVHGVSMWGSLGLGDCCRTAEESWALYRARKEFISQEIGRDLEDFAFNVINPVYDNQGDLIRDIYVDKALELASGRKRLVALDFKDIEFAQATIERFETIFPKERLAHLAISFDAEHFPSSQVDARAINEFSAWFGQKHQGWAEGKLIPGLIFIYIFPGSKILNLPELNQYYLDQKTLVLPLFDGYGTQRGKESGINEVVRQLPDSEDFPALIGAMEFKVWGNKYDKCTIKQTYGTLDGQPTKFLASQ